MAMPGPKMPDARLASKTFVVSAARAGLAVPCRPPASRWRVPDARISRRHRRLPDEHDRDHGKEHQADARGVRGSKSDSRRSETQPASVASSHVDDSAPPAATRRPYHPGLSTEGPLADRRGGRWVRRPDGAPTAGRTRSGLDDRRSSVTVPTLVQAPSTWRRRRAPEEPQARLATPFAAPWCQHMARPAQRAVGRGPRPRCQPTGRGRP